MASNDRNSKAFCRCLKSIGLPSNAALRVHVPRRKIASPSTRRSLLADGTVARGCRSSCANPPEWREPVAACIPCREASADRMHCDLCRKRGLPVGSGVVENACKHIVGNHWSKACANGLLSALCCFENLRWPDLLDWRACRAAAARPKNGMRPGSCGFFATKRKTC